MGQEVEGIG